MDQRRGLYKSFDHYVWNLSRGRYAVMIAITSVLFTYTFRFTPVFDYPPPTIPQLVFIGSMMAVVAYLIRPNQRDISLDH